jgi:hypothetical protein
MVQRSTPSGACDCRLRWQKSFADNGFAGSGSNSAPLLVINGFPVKPPLAVDIVESLPLLQKTFDEAPFLERQLRSEDQSDVQSSK